MSGSNACNWDGTGKDDCHRARGQYRVGALDPPAAQVESSYSATFIIGRTEPFTQEQSLPPPRHCQSQAITK